MELFSLGRREDRLCGLVIWLQIQGSGFDSRSYQIFWEVVGLERGPLPRDYNWGDTWKKVATNFADKRLGRYSSFADSGHGVEFGF
jgi:hypothetical protein